MPLGPITFDAARSDDGRSILLSVIASDMTKIQYVEIVSPPPTPSPWYVRGSVDAVAVGGAWRGTDFEAPGGVDVKYRVKVEGDDDSDTAIAYATVSGGVDYGGDWIMPVGYPSLGMNINVEYGGVGPLERDAQRDVLTVIGRPDPVVVSYGRSDYATSITFITLDDGERDAFLSIMQAPVVMFVARPGFGFTMPQFYSPGLVSEVRTVGLGSEQSRRFNVDVVRVAKPPAYYASDLPSTDWQAKVDDGGSWQDASDSGIIWFDFAGYRVT